MTYLVHQGSAAIAPATRAVLTTRTLHRRHNFQPQPCGEWRSACQISPFDYDVVECPQGEGL